MFISCSCGSRLYANYLPSPPPFFFFEYKSGALTTFLHQLLILSLINMHAAVSSLLYTFTFSRSYLIRSLFPSISFSAPSHMFFFLPHTCIHSKHTALNMATQVFLKRSFVLRKLMPPKAEEIRYFFSCALLKTTYNPDRPEGFLLFLVILFFSLPHSLCIPAYSCVFSINYQCSPSYLTGSFIHMTST